MKPLILFGQLFLLIYNCIFQYIVYLKNVKFNKKIFKNVIYWHFLLERSFQLVNDKLCNVFDNYTVRVIGLVVVGPLFVRL